MRALDCDIIQNKSLLKKEQLSVTQHVLLEIMQLLPIFTVAGMLKITQNANPTMIAFFIGVIVLPLAYCHIYKQNIKDLLIGDGMQDIKMQITRGLAAAIGILALALGAYFAFLGVDPKHHFWVMSLSIPVKKTFIDTAIFFFVFSFLNPLMEELFWRAFLLKTYKRQTWAIVSITFHYTLYHFFSIQFVTGSLCFSAVGTVAVLVLGTMLMYIREKYGMIAAVLAHLGGDLAVGIVCSHLYSQYIL